MHTEARRPALPPKIATHAVAAATPTKAIPDPILIDISLKRFKLIHNNNTQSICQALFSLSSLFY